MRVDLDALRLFLAVLDAGTITGGAQSVHLSLSAASERIRNLEDMLGATLLERSRRGVTPTAAGTILAGHARAIEQRIEHIGADLAPFAKGLRGRIRLLCNTSVLTEFLPEALGDFLARHRDIDVELREYWSHEIAQRIREQRADLGILSDSTDASGLEVRTFREDRLVLLAPTGHPLSANGRARFSDVLDWPMIGLAEDSALSSFLDDRAARIGRTIEYRARLRSFDSICRMVGRGAGIAVLPQHSARQFATAEQTISELADEWASRKLLLCARSFDALPGYVRELVDALQPTNAAAAGLASEEGKR